MKNLFIILCFPLGMFAQDVDVRWGKSIPLRARSSLQYVCGTYGSNVYSLRLQSTGLFGSTFHLLEITDARTLNRLRDHPVLIPKLNGQEAELKKLIVIHGIPELFCTSFNKTTRTLTAFIQPVGASGGSGGKRRKILFEQKGVKGKYQGKFDLISSEDSSRFLLSYRHAFQKDSNKRITIKMFDSSFAVQTEQFVRLPYKDKQCSILNIMIGHSGKVIILAKINPATRSERFSIFVCSPFESAVREVALDIPEYNIRQVKLLSLDSLAFIATGFCTSAGNDQAETDAAFFLLIRYMDPEIKWMSVNAFTREDLLKFLSAKEADRGHGLQNIRLRHVLKTKNDCYVLTGEKQYYRQTCITDPHTGMLECSDNYYFDDIIVIKMDHKGRMQWLRRIPKKQYSNEKNATYVSFLTALWNDEVYIMFNDDPGNLRVREAETARRVTNPQRSMAALVRIDPEGMMSKRPLFGSNAHHLIIYPKKSFRLAPHCFLLYNETRRYYSFGMLQIR